MNFILKPGFKKGINKRFRFLSRLRSFLFNGSYSGKATPIIINNYNRLTFLKLQLTWLEANGYNNIYIIDNKSTYPPLLEFYKNCKHHIFFLTENVGHTALWDTHIAMWFKDQYYVYTDPDVIPVENCPENVLDFFYQSMKQINGITKVGFGLKIDDLPDHYARKEEVIQWESKFWELQVGTYLYKAAIDTTFALYKPNTVGQQWETSLRTGGNYMARHLPWYDNTANPSQEEIYFRNVTTKTSSWYKEERYNG